MGIITANASCLTAGHLENTGITRDIPLIIRGMENRTEFRQAILEEKGTLDSDLIQSEVVGVARELAADHPEVGSILLECSDLPPYAHAVQAETGLPVFDFITMIEYVHHTLVRRPYRGLHVGPTGKARFEP